MSRRMLLAFDTFKQLAQASASVCLLACFQFTILAGFTDCVLEYNVRSFKPAQTSAPLTVSPASQLEQLRVRSLDGGESLIRSFPSRVRASRQDTDVASCSLAMRVRAQVAVRPRYSNHLPGRGRRSGPR